MTNEINTKEPNKQEQEPKLYYLEYIYESEQGKQLNYIAAYTLQQADNFYVQDILSKENVEERDMIRMVISDERALELGLTAYTKPGVIS